MNNKKVLAGAKLAGGNPENGRVEDDYYATNPEAVKMLLTKYTFDAHTILEPCVVVGISLMQSMIFIQPREKLQGWT